MNTTIECTAVPLSPALAASVAPGWCDLTVEGRASVSVDIGVGEMLAVADMLRVFEGLRRELSRRLIGRPGAFIGYDRLTLPRSAATGPQRVVMEALLLAQTERLHEVQYTAASVSVATMRLTQGRRVLACGRGRTLHVPTRPGLGTFPR